MGRVEAWSCDQCGMLAPDEGTGPPPITWIKMTYEVIGEEAQDLLVCGSRCAGLYFKSPPAKAATTTKRKRAPRNSPDAPFACEHCGTRYFKKSSLYSHLRYQHPNKKASNRKA